MRSIIILMAIILMLTSSVLAECVDTDEGKNYGVKGTTTYTKGSYQDVHVDFCSHENSLVEYFCEESTGKPSSEFYHCDCVDGACVDEEEVVEEITEEIVEEVEEEVEIPPEETIDEEPEVPTESSDAWIWISAVIIAILIAVLMVLKKKKAKKEK